MSGHLMLLNRREWLCKYEDMPDGSQHIFHRVVLVSRPHSPVFGEITITPVSVGTFVALIAEAERLNTF
jgi:hypothetical protein